MSSLPPPAGGSSAPDYGGWTPPGGPPPPYQGAPPQDQQPWLPQPAQPPKKGRGKLIASVAAVLVLAGGGVGTYVALSDSSSTGAATPQEAVHNVFADLQKSDLIGVLDDLAPAERDSLAGPINDQISNLKRLHVLDSSADAHHVPGFTFSSKNLTLGTPQRLTDKVDIVTLTGGRIDVSLNAARIPVSHQLLSVVGGHVPSTESTSSHVNLADVPTPPKLAVQQVDGRWYPSLFYTIAYNASGQKQPSSADHIPAAGAHSPQGAVGDLVRALLKGDPRSAIELLSPDEMAIMHDYGGMVADSSAMHDTGATISSLQTTTTDLSDGAVRVGLKKVVVNAHGQTISVSVNGDCVTAAGGGQSQKFCANDVQKIVSGFEVNEVCGVYSSGGGVVSPGRSSASSGPTSSGATCHRQKRPTMTASQKQAFADVFRGFLKIGVVTTQSGGKWYVNPVRTYGDLNTTIESAMKDNDLLAIIDFVKKMNR